MSVPDNLENVTRIWPLERDFIQLKSLKLCKLWNLLKNMAKYIPNESFYTLQRPH